MNEKETFEKIAKLNEEIALTKLNTLVAQVQENIIQQIRHQAANGDIVKVEDISISCYYHKTAKDGEECDFEFINRTW